MLQPVQDRQHGKVYPWRALGGVTIAYVPVPKDLTNVKTKFLFNLTKRQLICFGGGAIIVMLPFFLLAMYEKNGQPLEKVVRNMANVLFIRAKKRPYRTKNFYIALEKQNELDKEVYAIVSGKAHTKRTKTN